MDKPIRIKSIKHLCDILDASENAREFFVQLLGGGRSWKTISFADKLDRNGEYKLEILNEIDEKRQILAIGSLYRFSNIGEAIDKGAFYLYDDNENYDKSDVKLYE
jgi:peptide subunit release factor RF-3